MSLFDGSKPSFLADYAIKLAGCAGNDFRDNYDWRRFGPEAELPPAPPAPPAPWRRKLGRWALDQTRNERLVRESDINVMLYFGMRFVASHVDNLQWLYNHLEEPESRDLLLKLLCYRALGYRYIKLPLNNPEHWKYVERFERMAEGSETVEPGFLGWQLPKLRLHEFGYPIDLFYRPDGVVTHFIQQQYRCQTATGAIEARPGDVVIDAGGCWGDSALYFAFKAGGNGKVYSFEFLPDNLTVYDRNLSLNPELRPRIEVLPHPVWSSGGEELFVTQNGPGTTVTPARQSAGDAVVTTMAIDQLMDRPGFTRIDFIKMDIEGAELKALHGAEQTLRRFRPRLAITVYHHLADFWEIPQYIESLGLGYQFYLRHFTTHAEETVLFAESNQV
ncbi:MAG: hypothetical protein C0485_06670 [Pirellula sp.]|nr:hypothetical protein [Pirellula sp.]